MAITPEVKLRRRKSDRSTIGCLFSTSSQTRNSAKPTTAMTPSATTTEELNQSSSLPLSSITCRHPTQITSSASPTVSTGNWRVGVSRLRYSIQDT